LMPPWETRIGPVVINNIFYSGVVVAGIIFGGLYAIPWLDRKFTGDYDDHNLLDRPRDVPIRTALGAASIMAVSILFVGGGQDIVARTFDISVGRVTTVLQIAFLVLPPITFLVTRHICISLRDRPGPDRTERRGPVVRTAGGGYHAASDDELAAAAEPSEGTAEAETSNEATSETADQATDESTVTP
ncbi:MAG: ubiquinol-cytochrome c reductase cytochrome b subunit, partial [Actinobacteria bacterium]|nr:ubiquinol-cytochrome c reductase cytochrome b subunit [Actinomycetota bacterium]